MHVDFRIALASASTASEQNITARGFVSWQFLFERQVQLVLDDLDFKGKLEVGLKQAFPDLEGWFVPSVEVIFPSRGSYAADTAFIKEHLISVEIKANYREYRN